jgi:hypothetical protein
VPTIAHPSAFAQKRRVFVSACSLRLSAWRLALQSLFSRDERCQHHFQPQLNMGDPNLPGVVFQPYWTLLVNSVALTVTSMVVGRIRKGPNYFKDAWKNAKSTELTSTTRRTSLFPMNWARPTSNAIFVSAQTLTWF